MEIADRIRLIIQNKNLKVPSFAKKIGVGDQTIRGVVVQKRNKPGLDVLSKIIETFPEINAKWLITGNGEMLQNAPATEKNFDSLEPFIQYLKEKDAKIENLTKDLCELRFKYEIETQKNRFPVEKDK